MLTQAEAIELARLMRQSAGQRAVPREDPEVAAALVRAMLLTAFGEADIALARAYKNTES